MPKNTFFDVIVAGAGPAGSTCATLLAQYGYRVLILEKNTHPRFHIGESMLPMAEPIMKRLKIDWREGNLVKGGAKFMDEQQGKSSYFPFQGKYSTVQVERSVFDQRLFENAISQGVVAHQQEGVLNVHCDTENVLIKTSQQYYEGRYFIDATGRSAIMGRVKQSLEPIKTLGKFAVYQHYQLDDNLITAELFHNGHIEIILSELGWFWCIPLTKKRLSIGLVVQKENQLTLKGEKLLDYYIKKSPRLTELLANSKALSKVAVEADFSYLNTQRYGVRYACCGDAAGFLDPVFSSGVFFALKTAEMVADQLHLGLSSGTEATINLHDKEDKAYQTGFQSMYLMIKRFYSSNMVDNLFFEAERAPQVKNEVIALLAGDLWTDNNLFQQGLLSG
ncbi:MAG: tryptophan 7-halogenase, partial [Methylococcales bacterium]|nr:tryptophan 7-halogenase [Methylococcales bacterium]